jgi:hypothetical protein
MTPSIVEVTGMVVEVEEIPVVGHHEAIGFATERDNIAVVEPGVEVVLYAHHVAGTDGEPRPPRDVLRRQYLRFRPSYWW